MRNLRNVYAARLVCDPRCYIFFSGTESARNVCIQSVSWRVSGDEIDGKSSGIQFGPEVGVANGFLTILNPKSLKDLEGLGRIWKDWGRVWDRPQDCGKRALAFFIGRKTVRD